MWNTGEGVQDFLVWFFCLFVRLVGVFIDSQGIEIFCERNAKLVCVFLFVCFDVG